VNTTTTHRITLTPADANAASYGITHRSAYVYDTSRSSSPTRVVVWSNEGRPNPRNGQPIRWGQAGPIDGGNGRYLDPSHQATDSPVTVLLTPESSVITANGTNTGTQASGQVYPPAGAPIRAGDTLTLIYPDGTEAAHVARFTNNGHGIADPT
jgi:hypothetical protein